MEMQGVCPWCGSESFYYNPSKQAYICFHADCSRKGYGRPPVEHWIKVLESAQEAPSPEEIVLPEDCAPLPFYEHHDVVSRRIYQYLQRHKINWDVARKSGLMYTHTSLVIVFHDENGKLVYFQERSVFGKKWFHNPKGIDRSKVLYWTDYFSDSAFVVESAMNAIRMMPFGPAVATLGAPLPEQINLIAQKVKNVIVMLDADAALGTLRTARSVSQQGVSSTVLLLEKGDPCDYTNLELRRLLHDHCKGWPFPPSAHQELSKVPAKGRMHHADPRLRKARSARRRHVRRGSTRSN